MIVKRSMRDCFLGPQLCRGVLRIQFYSSVHPSVCNAFFSGKNYYFSDFFAWSYHSVNTEKWRNPFRNKCEFWPKWDKLAGLLQILENPEKQFFSKSLWKPGKVREIFWRIWHIMEKSGNFLLKFLLILFPFKVYQ